MGSVVFQLSNKTKSSTMSGRGKGGKVKNKSKSRSSRLDFNSQLEGFIDCFAKATTLNELVQELQFIWLPSWNTLQRKFLNRQAMLLVITRKLGSSQDISSWLSGTTKN